MEVVREDRKRFQVVVALGGNAFIRREQRSDVEVVDRTSGPPPRP